MIRVKKFSPRTVFLLLLLLAGKGYAQDPPAVHQHMGKDEKGFYIEDRNGNKVRETVTSPAYTLAQMRGAPEGTEEGILFDFGGGLNGKLYYGFTPYGQSDYPLPVFFKKTLPIKEGKVELKIAGVLDGKYDMVDWQEKGYGTLAYRVANEQGELIYEGKVTFSGNGPFKVEPAITQGPFVNNVKANYATLTFDVHPRGKVRVTVPGTEQEFSSSRAVSHYEHTLGPLESDKEYTYKVEVGKVTREFSFRTAPFPGTRTPFTFAYASDSRAGQGGGERNMYGTNYYIMRRIMALNKQMDAAFMQFTGDLVDGYLTNRGEMELQYANWKRSVEPFAHYMPIYSTMGNHEALMRVFGIPREGKGYSVDRFPYYKESAEAVFSHSFTNPANGPKSEDGTKYDPTEKRDFPPYMETAYTYTYDNVGMIVLNSDYFYAPSLAVDDHSGGNLHGYIMDGQFQWLQEQLQRFDGDGAIDHVFITLHTPFFPNGGHSTDDMWYGGSNEPRPVIAGRKVEKGIIERRDQLLDLIVNQHEKVVAILTGDEHNYNKLKLTPETPIYPEEYKPEKIELSRTIYQINNGSAGAPYYAQEELPWSDYVTNFSTNNVVVYMHVDGPEVRMEVRDPRTFELIDELQLRE